MKKTILVALTLVCLCMTFLFSMQSICALTQTVVIKEMTGDIVSPNSENKVVLKGDKEADGIYFKNVRVEIFDKNKLLCTIKPTVDSGYGPDMMLTDFVGNGTQQIFVAMGSGGSGGFGLYYVYSFENQKIKTMFDFEQFSKQSTFTGKFLNDFKAEVVGKKGTYMLGFSLRPQVYKDKLWEKDGKLIEPIIIDISGVNTVFPYYNSFENKCQMIVYQKVTGIAQVDSLGYIISQLDYKKSGFEVFYQGLMIFPQSPSNPMWR